MLDQAILVSRPFVSKRFDFVCDSIVHRTRKIKNTNVNNNMFIKIILQMDKNTCQ